MAIKLAANYIINFVEILKNYDWDEKGNYLNWIDLISELFKMVIYGLVITVFLAIHVLPLFALRSLVRSIKYKFYIINN